jgi:hypothetical protein
MSKDNFYDISKNNQLMHVLQKVFVAWNSSYLFKENGRKKKEHCFHKKLGGLFQLLQGKGCMNSHDNCVMQTKIHNVNY